MRTFEKWKRNFEKSSTSFQQFATVCNHWTLSFAAADDGVNMCLCEMLRHEAQLRADVVVVAWVAEWTQCSRWSYRQKTMLIVHACLLTYSCAQDQRTTITSNMLHMCNKTSSGIKTATVDVKFHEALCKYTITICE